MKALSFGRVVLFQHLEFQGCDVDHRHQHLKPRYGVKGTWTSTVVQSKALLWLAIFQFSLLAVPPGAFVLLFQLFVVPKRCQKKGHDRHCTAVFFFISFGWSWMNLVVLSFWSSSLGGTAVSINLMTHGNHF